MIRVGVSESAWLRCWQPIAACLFLAPGLWDWYVHLPHKHGLKWDGMIFLGGQVSLDKEQAAVHPDDLTAKTHQATQYIGTIPTDLGAGL